MFRETDMFTKSIAVAGKLKECRNRMCHITQPNLLPLSTYRQNAYKSFRF